MREFIDGAFFEKTFPIADGWMVTSGDVRINGTSVCLNEFDFQPLDRPLFPIGVGGTLSILKALLELARAEGYTRLVVEGKRISGRNPQRRVRYERSTI